VSKLLFEDSDWSFETIERVADACAEIADEELGLNCYPNQFEVITSTQMLDAYASVGMPVGYNHWSFGKVFVGEEQKYRSGKSGLAYELVINSNPCINYLMEENSATIQALVIAHAGFGHNHFFKNNYLFKEWTKADSIIDYLLFAKNYIAECEERYGYHEVERIIDSAHALRNQGIDRYKKPSKLSIMEEKNRQKEREEYIQSQVNVLWQETAKERKKKKEKNFPPEPEENILKFIEKNSPSLETWQREIIRIVRMISQYFYPQRQTKVMNEGFACWVHCYMLERLYDKGLISEGAMLEFKHVHSNVVWQGDYTQMGHFNPYALGLNMFRDIERICKDPTKEDREWFPDIAGENHIEVIKHAVENYRDESFVRQFLSPKLMRDMRMFSINNNSEEDFYEVRSIHNRDGYRKIRSTLADQYEVGNQDPNIQVVNSNIKTTRTLELVHHVVNGELLEEEDAMDCIFHMKRLWGYEVDLASIDENDKKLDDFSTSITLDLDYD
jgi:spore cortex formation protein SpoVR/YcgB (stage V sporulation)